MRRAGYRLWVWFWMADRAQRRWFVRRGSPDAARLLHRYNDLRLAGLSSRTRPGLKGVLAFIWPNAVSVTYRAAVAFVGSRPGPATPATMAAAQEAHQKLPWIWSPPQSRSMPAANRLNSGGKRERASVSKER
jgi:hypothetical protein